MTGSLSDEALADTLPGTPDAPPRSRSRHIPWLTLSLSSVSVIALLLVWQWIATQYYSAVFFPAPTTVIQEGADSFRDGSIYPNIWASLRRILLGFTLGSLVGAPIGLLMGSNKYFRAVLTPHIQFFRFIPSIAWLTPFVIWFGIGETPKVLLIFYTTVFIVALASSAGVGHIPQNMLRAGQALGASERQLLRLVILPAVVPHILSGMRFAMGPAFTTVVAAEMIAADQGLGQMIESSRVFLQTGRIFVAMVVLGLLGLLTDTLFRALIRHFAGQYGPVD